MIQPLVIYPDSSLRVPCKEVPPINEWFDLRRDLIETVRHHRGYGLSAPQIGKPYRIFIFQGIFCVDPQIIKKGGSTSIEEEGCLSIPNVSVPVERYVWIKVKYLTFTETKIESKLMGLSARIFQHELDHLNGILIIDRGKK